MDTAAILNIVVTANTAQATAALAKTQAQMSATQKRGAASMATLGKAFVGLGVAAGAAGFALFKVGEEFDATYDKIRTQTGATGKEMVKLKRSFRDVVSDVPADFETAGKAVGELNTRLGLSGKPLNRMAKQMTELSRITETDVSDNIESVSKAFVDWEVKTKDQTKTLDGFFRLSQRSGMAVSDIAENVQKFGSPLRQLGFSLDEAASMFANFERAGVNIQTMVPGLKLALANLTQPTDDLGKKLEQLGIKAGDPERALKQVFDILSDDNRSRIEKTGLAMDVFGKRAGADMAEAVSQGRFELDKFLKIMRDGDGTIRETGRKTMDLDEHFQVFANNLKLLVEPVAKDVFKGISDLMKEITAAFKKGGVEGIIDLLVKKFEEAIPKITALGGKIASALIEGIISSPSVAAFIAGGWLLKTGLASIGRTAGAAIGSPMGLAIAATAASAFAGAKLSSKLIADPKALVPTNMEEGLGHLADALDITREHARRLSEFMAAHKGLGIPESMKLMREEARATKQTIERFGNTWGLSMDEIRQRTKQNFQAIRRTMGTQSMEAKIAVMNNFEAAKDAIKNSMDAGEISAKQGAKAIHQVLVRQLKSYGIKDVEGFLNRQEQASAAHEGGGASGLQAGGLAAMVPGSGIGDRHTLSVDGVPKAKVESGEGIFVGNRKMMAAAAKANSMVPRFAEGGGLDFALGPYTVPPITYDADHAGGNSHVHISGSPPSWVVAIGHQLQRMGNLVGEHPAFGGVAPGVHGNYGPTDHYHAGAIDVNAGDGVENQGWVASIARILGGEGVAAGVAAAVEKLKLPRFSSDFGLGALVATGLNNMAAGVETVMDKRLARRAPAGTDTAGLVGGSAAANAQLGHQMLVMKPGRYKKDADTMTWGPWGESEWPSYNELIMSESGWSTTATNPSSGAYGIPQSLPASKMAAAGSDWKTNAATQIAWGLDYIEEVYGAPSATPLGGYRRGGLLAKMAEGGPVWPEKLLGPGLGDVLQRIAQDEEPPVEALQGLMGRIHGVEPNMIREGELLGKLADLRQMADQNLEWSGLAAQRDQEIPWDLEFNAGKWNIMNEKGKAIESFSSEAEAIAKYTEMIEPLLGLFHGHTEQFWRSSELDNLWSLRKRLILAARQMKERREQMHDALQVANERRREWQSRVNDINKEGHTPGDLRPPDPNKDIQEWNKQSDKDRRDKGRAFEKEGGRLAGDRAWAKDGSWRLVAVGAGAKRVLGALENKIIPALTEGETRFNDARVSLLNDHLATVQGTGMSMRGLDNRPPVDELLNQFAGEINSSAFRLQELRADPRFTDTTEEPEEAPTWTIGQLAEFAQALRYGAFTSLGFAGQFAGGGLIPSGQFGLVGEKGPEFISGPTQVTPTGPMPTPMIFADVYIGGQKIDERVRAEITGQKNSDNLRLRARHVQR